MRPSSYPMLDAATAAASVLERIFVLGPEEVQVAQLRGRVLAADLHSTVRLPGLPLSAVDGYAHRTADSGGWLRVTGESAAGRPYAQDLGPGQAVTILTGGVVPAGADAVVMVEDVTSEGDGIRFASTRAGANINPAGADVEVGELVLAQGTQLGPAEIALVAALGRRSLPVHRRPRVALMSTGDELLELGCEPGPGQIVDSNRWALGAALEETGAEVTMLGIAPDEPGALRALVEGALLEHDVLVTSGGVSVGSHDLVKPLLAELGQIHVGRVKVRPGKPFTFATLGSDKVAFGLPGFPVSSLVTFEVFVRPALRRMQGHSRLQRLELPVQLGYDAQASGDRTDFQRVRLQAQDGVLVAHSTGRQASSRLLSMVGAQGLVRIPPGERGLLRGEAVTALLLSLD